MCIRDSLFFEKLFFDMDTRVVGWVDLRDVSRFLSYVALDMSLEERIAWITGCLAVRNDDAKITRPEFLAICLEKLWNYPEEVIEKAAENFTRAQQIFSEAPNKKWQRIAMNIDAQWRWILPVTYTLMISFIFNLEIDDGYDDDQPLFVGMSYKGSHVRAHSYYVPVVIVGIFLVWCLAKGRTLRKEQLKAREERTKATERAKEIETSKELISPGVGGKGKKKKERGFGSMRGSAKKKDSHKDGDDHDDAQCGV